MTVTDTAALTRKVGQRVLISGGRFHGPARIVKLNPKNVVVEMEGSRRRVNSWPGYLTDLAEGEDAPSRWDATASSDVPTQDPGAIVKVRGKDGLFVVLADKWDKINVARLGGDNGRYYRQPRSTVVPVDDVLVTA